ncbi:uncharacterized protein LOC116022975 [Ipomoea triloba]|uniref:uncharacterized protein LOC116022975 n=1 Tax=Ipomoea triloba TaxID=35885 RepID=UPI00125E87AA|nr:uncharacterized protein LOC116022975 [Ipomoea triloba]
MTGAKPVITLMCPSADLHTDVTPFDSTSYRRAIGRLEYLAIARPDISFTVNCLAQFMARGCPLTLVSYSDSDWGGVRDRGHYAMAYCVFFCLNLVSWKSTKQRSVSRSSTEVEFQALTKIAAFCYAGEGDHI